MSEELFGQCDECSSQSILYNAIVEGKTKKLCRHCLNSSNAIEIKKPKKISLQTGRPSVKQILMKMSGLDKEKEKNELPNLKEGISKQPGEITLNDLIERRWQMKKEKDVQEKEKKEVQTKEEPQVQAAHPKEKQPEQSQSESQLDLSKPLDFNIKTTKNISIGDLVELKKQKEQQEQKLEKKKD